MHSMAHLLVTWIFALLLLRQTSAGLYSSTDGISLLNETDGRLSGTLRPYHYNVEFFPNIYLPGPPFPFSGHVDIYLDCFVSTNVIILHSKGLTINQMTISISASPDTPGSPPDPGFLNFSENTAANFLYFQLENYLQVDEKYLLKLDFTGVMRSDNKGLYYDSYLSTDGSTNMSRYIAATQFEAIAARLAFPCFDEPDMKATFNLTIVRDETSVALANTPIASTESRPDGYFADTFRRSPVMSNYLLCFGVGDFRSIVSRKINGYQVRIWSRPDLLPQMQFAADVAAKFQAWLDTETGITYREPKIDHLALPSKIGAMENWGLIIYPEDRIAVNSTTASSIQKLTVASYIGHELAHQWYGNLVTCKWWTEIWLNEGFASHYQYYTTESIGWQGSLIQQINPRGGVQAFYDVDQKNTSDPVRKQIKTTWDAMKAFRGSTYPKGGAMIRMIRAILGPATFKRAMTRYLKTHQYTGVTTDDYWNALTAQAADDGATNPDGSPLDMKARMDPWLNQMGYPLINFTNNGDGSGTVSRTHFLSPVNQIMETPSQWNYTWDVPITVVTSESAPSAWDARPVAWIDIGQTETTLNELPASGGWVIINAKQNMFYRVLYDTGSLDLISAQLVADHSVIDAESRSQVVDDTFTLSRAGYLSITYAMENTRYLDEEFVYNAWGSALKHFQHINRIFKTEPWFFAFEIYVRRKSRPVYEHFGWLYDDVSEPITTHYLRRVMISTSCSYGDTSCLATARQQYSVIAADPASDSVDPNNLPTVLCTGVKEGSSADWTLWFNVYLNRKSSQIRDERYAYLFGLSCTTDTTLLDRYLDELVVQSNIAQRDRNTATQYLAVLDYGGSILWNYLDTNWTSVRPGIDKWWTMYNIIKRFSTPAQALQLNDFISRHLAESETERNNFVQLVLLVQQNIEWRTSNTLALRNWLFRQQMADVPLASGYQMTTSGVHH